MQATIFYLFCPISFCYSHILLHLIFSCITRFIHFENHLLEASYKRMSTFIHKFDLNDTFPVTATISIYRNVPIHSWSIHSPSICPYPLSIDRTTGLHTHISHAHIFYEAMINTRKLEELTSISTRES